MTTDKPPRKALYAPDFKLSAATIFQRAEAWIEEYRSKLAEKDNGERKEGWKDEGVAEGAEELEWVRDSPSRALLIAAGGLAPRDDQSL
jgi:hypothetical protein